MYRAVMTATTTVPRTRGMAQSFGTRSSLRARTGRRGSGAPRGGAGAESAPTATPLHAVAEWPPVQDPSPAGWVTSPDTRPHAGLLASVTSLLWDLAEARPKHV